MIVYRWVTLSHDEMSWVHGLLTWEMCNIISRPHARKKTVPVPQKIVLY